MQKPPYNDENRKPPGRKKAPIPDRDERLARGTTLIKGNKRLSLWVPVTGQNGRVWLHSRLAFCYPSFGISFSRGNSSLGRK